MTNEATSSDVEKLITEMESSALRATPGPWRRASTRFNGITHGMFSFTKEDILGSFNEKCNSEFVSSCDPKNVLSLISTLKQSLKRNAQLSAERDALRESGLNGQANTRAAADIYFQLIEECNIQPGGSLVEHIDGMRDRITELESAPHHNGMMQLSNELAEMKRKCTEQASTKKYNVGEATMRHIFMPTGLTNVSDMQAVFDRMETVLVEMDRKCSTFESGEYGFFAYWPQHGEEIFKNREDAIEFCNEAIEDYRQVNAEEGCDEKEVRRVCWGVIMQTGTDIAIDDDGHIDYALNPVLGTVEVIEIIEKNTMVNDHE